jgi:hypothetical protein
MWEVLFEEPKTMRGGNAKNQVVVDPDKVHLTSLTIFPICADGRKHNDDTYVFDYMCVFKYMPELEANPLDVIIGLINMEERNRHSLRAYNFRAERCGLQAFL